MGAPWRLQASLALALLVLLVSVTVLVVLFSAIEDWSASDGSATNCDGSGHEL